jgi:hypothetical protein
MVTLTLAILLAENVARIESLVFILVACLVVTLHLMTKENGLVLGHIWDDPAIDFLS